MDYLKLIIRIFIFYQIIFGVLPFVKQKEVSSDYKQAFDLDRIYQDSGGKEWGHIISSNDEARKAKVRAINGAEERIIYSTYRIQYDQSAKDLLGSLVAAADRGVEVDLITDGLSLINNKDCRDFIAAIASIDNINFKVYNPLNIIKPWTYNGRLHDKYILIDDDLLFIGGRNTEDRFNRDDYHGKNYDWDISIYFEERVKGDSFDQLEEYFTRVFNYQYSKEVGDILLDRSQEDLRPFVEELRDNQARLKSNQPDLFIRANYKENSVPMDNSTLIYNPIEISSKEPQCFYALSQIFMKAEKRIHIHTPYFIGNEAMYDLMEDLADRVDLTLFTNSVKNASNAFGAAEYYSHRDDMYDTGMDILELQKDYPYHGKVFLVDDNICSLGSFNMDMRSMYLDTELMMVIKGEEITKEMEKEMKAYEVRAAQLVGEDQLVPAEGKSLEDFSSSGEELKFKVLAIVLTPVRFLL